MQSTMMNYPLTLAPILERAGRLFGASEIVSRLPEKSLHRYRYRDFHRRAMALGGALPVTGAAGICYTAGTTGKPKGVVYSHRAIVLHSLACAMGDTLGLKQSDSLCPVVPMFHVNAWGLPFTSVMVGCKLVLPGPHLDAVSLLDLYQSEQVPMTAGGPPP